MKKNNGHTLPSREQHSSFLNLPNIFPPTLALLCPALSLLCCLTTLRDIFLSGVNQCVLSSSGKFSDWTAEHINLLIWPWWHAYSTHSPPQSPLPQPFLLSVSPWALFLVTHTLFLLCCACGTSLSTALECNSNYIVVASWILEAIAWSISTYKSKVSKEVIGGLRHSIKCLTKMSVGKYVYLFDTQAYPSEYQWTPCWMKDKREPEVFFAFQKKGILRICLPCFLRFSILEQEKQNKKPTGLPFIVGV